MAVTVKKWGNSAAVRIPAAVMNAAGISLEQSVEVRADGRRIVIDPVDQEYDLNSLLDGITPDNQHEEIDFGLPRGKEFF